MITDARVVIICDDTDDRVTFDVISRRDLFHHLDLQVNRIAKKKRCNNMHIYIQNFDVQHQSSAQIFSDELPF